MKKDSINLFPTRRSTLLFHMRTNIIERCTNIVFTLLENPQKKSPSFLGHLWPKSGGIRLPTSSRSLRSQCFKNETFLAISTTVDDGELYGPSQLTFFCLLCQLATIIIVLGSRLSFPTTHHYDRYLTLLHFIS